MVRHRGRIGSGRIRVFALALVALLSLAPKRGVWLDAERVTGQTMLDPGESVVLRFQSAMANDQLQDFWWVDFQVVGLSTAEGATTADEVRVQTTGRVVEGTTDGSCEEVLEYTDTNSIAFNLCYLELRCPGGAASCEAVVEFQMLSRSDASVTVEWMVNASVSGPDPGCACHADDVEASVTLEVL